MLLHHIVILSKVFVVLPVQSVIGTWIRRAKHIMERGERFSLNIYRLWELIQNLS